MEITMKFIILQSLLTFALAEEYFRTSDSEQCKTYCIDSNHHFCPDSDRESGVCCEETDCPNDDFCSFNAGNRALKYWACPTDPGYCGWEHMLVPEQNVYDFIKPKKDSGFSFFQG